MAKTVAWITSAELWDAVERVEGCAVGLGERLRPWLNAGKIAMRAEVIARNEIAPSAVPECDLPRAVLSRIGDDSLFVGSDRLVITEGSWAGEVAVFEAVGLTFNKQEVFHALKWESGRPDTAHDELSQSRLPASNYEPPKCEATRPPKWASLSPKRREELAMEFFGKPFAEKFMPGGSEWKGKANLRSQYVAWLTRSNRAAEAYAREHFEKLFARHTGGVRIEDHKWALPQ